MTAGGAERERETRTATSWGMKESGAVALHREAMVGEGKTGKSISTAADEIGAQDCYGARLEQRGQQGGRR